MRHVVSLAVVSANTYKVVSPGWNKKKHANEREASSFCLFVALATSQKIPENLSTRLPPDHGPAEARGQICVHPGRGSHQTPACPRPRHLSNIGLPRLGRRRSELPPFPIVLRHQPRWLGATLKKQQLGRSVHPIFFISLAALDSERSWTPHVTLKIR